MRYQQVLKLINFIKQPKLGKVVKTNGIRVALKWSNNTRKVRQHDSPATHRIVPLNTLDYVKLLREYRSINTNMEPPKAVYGMTELNRENFKIICSIPALIVPVYKIKELSPKLKHLFLKKPHIKPVTDLSVLQKSDETESANKVFLFDPIKVKGPNSFSDKECHLMKTHGLSNEDLKWCNIDLVYDNWTAEDVFKAVLPQGIEGVSGFSIIGHIIHLNLKEELLPYKHLIGQVLLDKNSCIETVVNKMNNIDNTFRNFSMEVLAGKEDFITSIKEFGCTFNMDFSKVYWNSRLGTEHRRLVDILKRGDILYDVFAGIGPFAIPAARKYCHVLANDLNPESYRWLNQNITSNKIKHEFIKTYNMDGREFIKTVIGPDLLCQWKENESERKPTHIVMNLPGLAIDFLDAFVGLFSNCEETFPENSAMPTVYCYCFERAEGHRSAILSRIAKAVNVDIGDSCDIRLVRNISPGKDMYCVTFTLSKEILFQEEQDCQAEQPSKRQKIADC